MGEGSGVSRRLFLFQNSRCPLDPTAFYNASLRRRRLRAIRSEVLLVVDGGLACTSASADALLPAAEVGLMDGDVVLVGTSSPRVLVVNHEGWIFDLDLAPP